MSEALPVNKLRSKPSFENRFDLRSFGEPLKALRKVPIHDNGEILLDLRVHCPAVILSPGCLPFLRSSVIRMVNDAASLLPAGYILTVGTCLRTTGMQRSIRENFLKEMREKHPEWTTATMNRMLNRMVAPYDDISPAPHTTGGAIDVGIRDSAGKDIDFGTSGERWEAAPTYYHKLSEAGRTNRQILIKAMESAGLTNYVGEWWHWSYGDQGWALRVGSSNAHYGAIEIPDAENQRIPKESKNESDAQTPQVGEDSLTTEST